MKDEINWSTWTEQKMDPIGHGDRIQITLPVEAVSVWSDKIIASVDDDGNVLEYTSGFILHIPATTKIYNKEPYIHLGSVSVTQ